MKIKKAPDKNSEFRFTADKRYLHLPVRTGATSRRLRLLDANGTALREMDVELELDGEPSLTAALDLAPWQGEDLVLELGTLPPSQAEPSFVLADTLPHADRIYRETYRPLVHFTSRIGWLNDPNGLVYHDGEWHLFYQHNPYGWNWGNMHWGHAVSRDLVRWRELGDAIFPWSDCRGAAFSGSAVIDHADTSGFGTDGQPALVAAYTDTGLGECIAFSTDRGRSFSFFEGNPVVKHTGRDPKIFRHEPTGRWVMALYSEDEENQWITIHSSPDLKAWEYHSRLEGWFECPELFELPVDGDPDDTRWILYAADTRYAVGSFDGRVFTPEHEGKHQLWHGAFYASQLFNDAPDDRRIQIGWNRGCKFPGMPFNQQMSVPVELSLTATPDGPRLCATPVTALATLRTTTVDLGDLTAVGGIRRFEVGGEALDLAVRVTPGDCERLDIRLRGRPASYDAAANALVFGKLRIPLLPLKDGAFDLRLIVDRGSIEIFAQDGRVAACVPGVLDPAERTLSITAVGGTATLHDLTIHTLGSSWE